MMKSIMRAVERLRKRFDFSAQQQTEAKAEHAAQAKRPPKRRRKR